ncbi:MAG: hypothetical protein N2V73_01805 [Candidatus Methanospirare jalkutatii]|nr:hypothetical protein [Candidatus Methanospirare jalkutatii]
MKWEPMNLTDAKERGGGHISLKPNNKHTHNTEWTNAKDCTKPTHRTDAP